MKTGMNNIVAERPEKEKKPYLHLFLLSITAVVWGASFVSQSVGMDHVGPFTYNGVRMLMGGTVLLPVIPLLRKFGITKRVDMDDVLAVKGVDSVEDLPWYDRKPQFFGGLFAGIVLFFASSFQQYAIQFTTTGKAGFITSLYVVLVPVFGIFLGHKIKKSDWAGVSLALVGLYLLSIKGGFYISHGDFFLILCAIFYAIHIIVLDHYSPMVDGVVLSSTQFFIVGLISLVPMFAMENPAWGALIAAGPPLLYSGILSSGVGFTLQTIGLQKVPPTQASLITSQESTLSVVFGWLLLRETMTGRELIGCAMMLTGVLISQLAPEKKSKSQSLT